MVIFVDRMFVLFEVGVENEGLFNLWIDRFIDWGMNFLRMNELDGWINWMVVMIIFVGRGGEGGDWVLLWNGGNKDLICEWCGVKCEY